MLDAKERSLPGGVLPLVPADPRKVGPYRLLGRLGTGGMGLVYLGERGPDLVAVKTLHSGHAADAQVRRRLRDEAALARRIDSCCIARVIEDGGDQPSPYLVTEFIEGPPLSQVVAERGPLSPESQHAVAIGVADALVAIHGAGVVHRDVKPSNVLLAGDGPRIIDFGIAHPLDGPEEHTQAGIVMGSPGWIAPERLTGGDAGAACDVFGWGMLVAYAAGGRHPFGEGDGEQIARRILTLPPDLTGMKEPLRGLAEAALAKNPALRPSAEDLLSTLLKPCAENTAALAVAELWAPPLPAAVPDAVIARPRRRSRLIRGWATIAVSLGAGALAGLLIGIGADDETEPPHVQVTVTTSVPAPPAEHRAGTGSEPGQAGGAVDGRGVAPAPPPEKPAAKKQDTRKKKSPPGKTRKA